MTTECREINKAPGMFEFGSKSPDPDMAVRTRKTMLLVDDEEAIRHIGQQLLSDMGYNVLLAKDGLEAVEIYRSKSTEIDIILLDIVMPNMGGREAYEQFKKINPRVRVLVWSGANVDDVATEMLKSGCCGFVHKPFSIKQLCEKIKEIIEAC